jgi:ATP-binding cassette subfamily F protein uup
MGYLQDFLFTPDQVLGPVGRLSGGEKNRVQLARILARPCNLLVLDEPTNDLDVPTLELLEELIAGFGGTLLLVSHDREFLDNVVTSILVWEGDGRWSEHAGGYSDWRARRADEARDTAPARAAGRAAASKAQATAAPAAKARKLTFTEAHELERLPDAIEALEERHLALAEPLAEPGFYKLPKERQQAARAELQRVADELARAMARWEELESRA